MVARDSTRDAVIAIWWNEARSRVSGRRRRETIRDDCISEKGSKVFELLEGGAAAAEGRKEKAQCLCEMRGVKFYSRSHDEVIRFFDQSGALIETHKSEDVLREP